MLRSIRRKSLALGATAVGAVLLAACTPGATAADDAAGAAAWPDSITIVQMPVEVTSRSA